MNSGTVLSLAAMPGDTIIAGFAEYGGTALSADQGLTWTFSGLPASVTSLAAGSNGIVYAADPDQGLFRSTDGGITWTATHVQYAYVVAVNNGGMIFTGTSEGVYRSTDFGASWDSLGGAECPFMNLSPIVSMSIDSNNVVFVGNSYTNVLRSTNNGDSWDLVGLPIPLAGGKERFEGTCNGAEVWSLHCDILNCIYAGTQWQSVYTTCDLGGGWFQSELTSGGAVRAVTSNSIGQVFVGTGDGVFRSTDRGISWHQINTGLTSLQIYSLMCTTDGYLYAGTGGGGIFRSIQETTSSQETDEPLANPFSLSQNYPNPFNPITIFSFSLRSSLFANLSVYDLLGREVATLVNEKLEAGNYMRQWDAAGMPSGVYFYRLRIGASSTTKAMVLLK